MQPILTVAVCYIAINLNHENHEKPYLHTNYFSLHHCKFNGSISFMQAKGFVNYYMLANPGPDSVFI